jgi:succinyl-diaminopimelate desuccinylase
VHITPDGVRAGEPAQMNVIPRDAATWLDVRTIPGVDHAAVVATVQARAEAAGRDAGVTAAVTVIDDRPAVSTSATLTGGGRALRGHSRGHRASRPPRRRARRHGRDGASPPGPACPPSCTGPWKWIAHQVDEYVDVAAISEAAEVCTGRPRCASSPRRDDPLLHP